jgi:hypothetical protein
VALSTVTTTKFPIVKTQPPSLVASGDNTLDILAANSAVVAETLPPEAQELAAVVAGPNVVLDPSDAAAIDWCIKNPGNKIYDRLLSKRGGAGVLKNTLRMLLRTPLLTLFDAMSMDPLPLLNFHSVLFFYFSL